MRHRMRGRKLGRNPSHRKAMFRNMACSLIRSVRIDENDRARPQVPGRIVTTLPKAKELRPFVEKLVTLARKAADHEEKAAQFETSAQRNTPEWSAWRTSQEWTQWNQAIAPAVTLRRRAFAILRDRMAVDILFDELATRFENRPGGYTRVVRLASRRLGDAGRQALIEFVGERDRVKTKRSAPAVVADEEPPPTDAEPSGEESTKLSDSEESEEEASTDEATADSAPDKKKAE